MAVDEITLRHLSHQRVRGAPATIPGAAGFVPEYTASELLRPTQRSLVCALEGEITTSSLRAAFARLEEVARAQKLKIAGEPLYVVKADPMVVVPNQRAHEVCLPVRGEAKEDGDIKPSRIEGGYHILCTTTAGLEDVENLYTWLFGKFLPARKHELTRPYILHRVVSGLEPGGATSSRAVIEVQVPATLSIKPARSAVGGEEAP
jgi:DNA gyrase inhibitor GyrI